jgi:NAD(P)-dependent dehydrogenase (short-subunit alcohol dehydrogenase family)
MPAELDDKVILITGASSGIGAATAVACAEAGMHVTLAARREQQLKDVARRCVEAGPPGIKAQWVICDVEDDKSVRRAFAESWTYFGRLDAIYAASKAAQKSLADGLRAEVAPRGMYVTSVHPIGTRTEFFVRAARRSGLAKPEMHVPDRWLQDPMRIGRGVVRAMRYRRSEVWGSTGVRLAMALMNAVPPLKAWAMRRRYHKHFVATQTTQVPDATLAVR